MFWLTVVLALTALAVVVMGAIRIRKPETQSKGGQLMALGAALMMLTMMTLLLAQT